MPKLRKAQRDNFDPKTVLESSYRVNGQCSNPKCRISTRGPAESNSSKPSHIGVGAHITAAAPGGPRYDPSLSSKDRKSIDNAIYLCENCAKMIDNNEGLDYSVETLKKWKNDAELAAKLAFGKSPPVKFQGDDPLIILKEWYQELQSNTYKTRDEIVEFFCCSVTPYIQKNFRLTLLTKGWDEKYQIRFEKINSLQQQVLQEVEQAFIKITQNLDEVTEEIQSQITEIDNILEDREEKEFTTCPKYIRAHRALIELLQILLKLGKEDLCAQYAVLEKFPKYIDDGGRYKEIIETRMLSFIFSPSLDAACKEEGTFNAQPPRDPEIIWEYFKTAQYFWNADESDLKKRLDAVFEEDPLLAISENEAQSEIKQVKNREKLNFQPVIFTIDLFKEGFKVLLNEIKLFLG